MKAQLRINGTTHKQLAEMAVASGLVFSAKPVTIGADTFETIVGVSVYDNGKKVGCFRNMGQGKGITLEVDFLSLSPNILAKLVSTAKTYA